MSSMAFPFPSMEKPNVIDDISVALDGKPNVIDDIAVALDDIANMLGLYANRIERKPGMLDRERKSIGVG